MLRVAVFIDGSNFYNGASRLLKSGALRFPILFNYGLLAQWLAGERRVVSKNYYVGIVRRDPGNLNANVDRMVRNQQRLFAWLESVDQGYSVVRGHIMKHPDKTYHEKGVDVRLAVDLVEGAFEDRYDVAILISSDTDLIPALQRVRKYKKTVEYIGFADRPSYGLQRYANITRLLTKEEISAYLPTTLFSS